MVSAQKTRKRRGSLTSNSVSDSADNSAAHSIPNTVALPPSQANLAGKDTSFATTAFILALISWIPLFNLFSNPIAIILAIISLVRIHKQPESYGGFRRSLAALVISAIWILLFSYALVYFGPAALFKR